MELSSLVKKASTELKDREFDITRAEDWKYIENLAQSLYRHSPSSENLAALERQVSGKPDDYPMMVQIATKAAVSKKLLSEIKDELNISIVFAVYNEHRRILSSSEDLLGEDFLIRKIEQMRFLCDEFENVCWDMFVVDDGCPNNSGKIARRILEEKRQDIIKENYLDNAEAEHICKNNINVLFLDEAIKDSVPAIKSLQSSADSRKGGSIILGMYSAVNQNKNNHIVVYTDADLSTHLGQSGLLINEIVSKKKKAAIGSRREERSIVVKTGLRNNRGKLFIYLWKRLIKPLNYIVDTQCGFKAFDAESLRQILEDTVEKQFAFDIELLLKTELLEKNSIQKVAIAWYDSEAASTLTDMQPYLSMLRAVVKIYRQYLPPEPEAEAFADFIEGLSESDWQKLVNNIPKEISDAEPASFDYFNGISVKELRQIITHN